MQIVVNVSKESYHQIKDGHYNVYDLVGLLMNGTVLPDNPTNGDMIKTMVPNCDFIEFIHDINVYPDNTRQKVIGNFDRDWWNSPYKGGQDGHSNKNT